MPPKKKPKRAKPTMKQKQRQTQIVTVNVGAPAVRRRRRAKKSASGTASAPPPPPPRQQFVQTIYPTTNPLQQDMHFNLASISAQLKNLQDKSVGGIALGSVPTQQQVQFGNPELDQMEVELAPDSQAPDSQAPASQAPASQAEDTPFIPIYVPAPVSQALGGQAPASRRADGEPEDTPFKPISVPAPAAPALQTEDLPKKRKKKLVLVPESEDLLVFGGQEFRTAIDPAPAARAAPMLRSVSAPTKQSRKERSDKDEPRGPLLRTAERDAFAHGASLMSVLHQDRPREQPTPFRPANTYAGSDRATPQPTITDFFGLRQASI